MDQFMTWDLLKEYGSFVSAVFAIVAFTKELPLVNKIPTKYWSAIISFCLLIIVNVYNSTFSCWDLVIYFMTSIFISLGANGLANFNRTYVSSKNYTHIQMEPPPKVEILNKPNENRLV